MKYFIKINSLFLIMLAQSCSINRNNIPGTYVSNCKAYGRPTEVCMLNSDSSFSYEFPVRKGEFIIGKYTLKEDTIVFKSESIKSGEIKEVVDPNDKYTQLPSLLIKNKGLFTIINYKIYSMDCFLVKQK